MFENRDLEGLLCLLNFDDKKELVKYAKNLTIYGEDFVSLIMACDSGVFDYIHQIHYRDIVPIHLQPNDEEREAISKSKVGKLEGKALKFSRKIGQLFTERRYLVGHIFYTSSLRFWHFFYFDQRDLSDRKNHWKHGPHLHFINDLWPNYTAQTLWNQFISGNPAMRDSIHIRYIHSIERPPSRIK